MTMENLHNRKYLKDRRKSLRNNLTPAEANLWTQLKKSQLNGRKFRRQHSIGNYIVDFYCPSENLIIEVDGGIHRDVIVNQNDIIRENHLVELGFKIIRFENIEVQKNIQNVLESIKSHFKKLK